MTATGFLTPRQCHELIDGTLPALLGVRVDTHEPGRIVAHLTVRDELRGPNGFLHAATVVALADTACGLGTRALLPEGSSGFTTIEGKTNYLGTAREGRVTVTATVAHSGRSTQVWDAEVHAGSRCTGARNPCCGPAVSYGVAMAALGSLFSRVARLANSPQGRQAVARAKEYAQRPETRAKIEQVRQKVVNRNGLPSTGPDDPQDPQSRKRSGTS